MLVTTLHLNEPAMYEMVSLMGFDAIWLDLEHVTRQRERATNLSSDAGRNNLRGEK